MALGVVVAMLVLAAGALAAGELTQKSGTTGCIGTTTMPGTCEPGIAMDNVTDVAVSPDGTSVYSTANLSDAIAVFSRAPATGELDQLGGTGGCVSESGSSGACENGNGLSSASGVAVSPDGEYVYATAGSSDAVTVFDRNPATGALDQLAGTNGCVSETGAGGCADGNALDGAEAVAVSPDGESVYVASRVSDAVAIFDRDASTGVLTQLAGPQACISQTGAGGCADGNALDSASDVAVSPGAGSSVYVAAFDSDAISVFDRTTGGAQQGELDQKAGLAGCISNGGAGSCDDGNALDGASAVALSPNGSSLYSASFQSDAISVFDRLGNGELDQKAGSAGCISETGAGGCADGKGLDLATDVAVSPDGTTVYSAAVVSSAVVGYGRDAATGALSQVAGTAGCVSEAGAGPCQDGVALAQADAVAVSPNSQSIYVGPAGSSFGVRAIAILDRAGSSPPQRTLTVTTAGTGGGTVTGPGITCPGDCSEAYANGTAVSLSATAGAGSSFAGFSGDCAGAACNLTMGADRAVTATFNASGGGGGGDTPPETTITKAPKKKLKKSKTKVKFTSSEPGSTFECRLKGKKAKKKFRKFKPCSSPFKLKGLKPGKYKFDVRAIDPAGNPDPTPAKAKFKRLR